MVGTTASIAQMSGVSQPEPVQINSSQEAAPVQHAAKPSAAIPMSYVPDPDAAPAPAPVLAMRAPVATTTTTTYAPYTGAAGDTPGRRALVQDPDAGIVTEVEGPANQLLPGTQIKARLEEALSTTQTQVGSPFRGVVTEAVMRNGQVMIPAGSVLSGRISEVHGGKRISGAATIHLVPTSVTLPDGTKYGLRAEVIDTDDYKAVKVNREGTIVRRDHPKETLAVLGLAAGGGVAAGGVFGGVPGALIGGGIGAGIGTVMWLKQDRQATLPADTKIVFALTDALVVGGA
jgi:hypothetical protein